jgi:hypothetical protein
MPSAPNMGVAYPGLRKKEKEKLRPYILPA